MFRAVATIVQAILISQPDLPPDDAAGYARVLQREAQEHEFDPLTGIAIIHFESGWDPGAISKSGEDYGLAQIRARYIGPCVKDRRPLKAPSPACKTLKQKLLTPKFNIETMADLITHHRKVCKKKTGSANFARWLASYQGRNYPKKKRWCVPTKETYKVIDYRRQLIRKLKKSAAKKAAKPR